MMIPKWLFILVVATAIIAYILAFLFSRQLYQWERQLRGARVKVYFKGRVAMSPRLIDWLHWANTLHGDRKVNGQVVYKQGGTTIAITKPDPRGHGKTTTKTVKEKTRA